MTKRARSLLLACFCFTNIVQSGEIMTVRGPIDSAELGNTLAHEHILVDFIGAEETGYHRWDREAVVEKVLPYLLEAKELGHQSILECTPAFLGRDPRLLETLSEKSGLHLITNTGYYGARQNKFFPEAKQALSIDELAAEWIDEFQNGIEDTGIRPGFIKTAVDQEAELSPLHEKLLRAACRVHLDTGLTIVCHTGPSPVIFKMVDVLESEGVAPDALVWTHATRETPENLRRAANLGVWVSIDNVMDEDPLLDQLVASLKALKESELLHRVLISHDAGWYDPEKSNGGPFRDYSAIRKALLPRLEKAGFEQEDFDQLLIENPRRAFELEVDRK